MELQGNAGSKSCAGAFPREVYDDATADRLFSWGGWSGLRPIAVILETFCARVVEGFG